MKYELVRKYLVTALLVAVILAVLGAIYFRTQIKTKPVKYIDDTTQLTILEKIKSARDHDFLTLQLGNCEFHTEIVNTMSSIQQGLSDRESLASASAMLFVMPMSAQYEFWMPRMHFALDIIWLRNGEVVDITANVPFPDSSTPLSALPMYKPSVPANFVLEVNANKSAECEIALDAQLQ
jgi:uncharacterized membrane protein (UPF0127 family)